MLSSPEAEPRWLDLTFTSAPRVTDARTFNRHKVKHNKKTIKKNVEEMAKNKTIDLSFRMELLS